MSVNKVANFSPAIGKKFDDYRQNTNHQGLEERRKHFIHLAKFGFYSDQSMSSSVKKGQK